MAKIDRAKRALGGAIKRTKPSLAAIAIVERKLAVGKVLDFGCGHGYEADIYGWDSYDPYYRSAEPPGPYDTIVCLYVLNALSRNNRSKVISRIRDLLAEDGHAYLAVTRDIPVSGKLGMHHSLQNYVVLTLPSVYVDDKVEICDLAKGIEFKDKTQDYVSLRDKRRDS